MKKIKKILLVTILMLLFVSLDNLAYANQVSNDFSSEFIAVSVSEMSTYNNPVRYNLGTVFQEEPVHEAEFLGVSFDEFAMLGRNDNSTEIGDAKKIDISPFINVFNSSIFFQSINSTSVSTGPPFRLNAGDTVRFSTLSNHNERFGLTNNGHSNGAVWSNSNGVVVIPSAGNWSLIRQNLTWITLPGIHVGFTINHAAAFNDTVKK